MSGLSAQKKCSKNMVTAVGHNLKKGTTLFSNLKKGTTLFEENENENEEILALKEERFKILAKDMVTVKRV